MGVTTRDQNGIARDICPTFYLLLNPRCVFSLNANDVKNNYGDMAIVLCENNRPQLKGKVH